MGDTENTPCEQCAQDARKAQLVGVAAGIAIGAAALYLFTKYVQR